MPILDRLVGLETEYAIRFQPADRSQDPLPRFSIYQALVQSLKSSVLTVPVAHFKQGVFLANGGAVWFEAERPAAGGGLIEGSTPECRGPRTALCYQRAQDQLFRESASNADLNGYLTLVKNDRDSRGNVYGAQENYEAIVASGWALWMWRVGLVLLFPILIVTWLGFLLMISVLLLYLAAAALLYLPLRFLLPNSEWLAMRLFGRDLLEGRETGAPTPAWLETTLLWGTRLLTAPLAAALFVLAAATVFRSTRRQLLPFLLSRSLFAGAGMLDKSGNFLIADKAPAINCVLGFGGFLRERPIFVLGHFFKAICAESSVSPREYLDLFRCRQRLQIGLGDSNMSEMAEFLRLGTTALVLDVIEAGQLPRPPRVRHPIQALHQLCSDPTLTCTVSACGGREYSALDLQRFYLNSCRRFLDSHTEVSEEATEIMTYWEQTLDALDALRDAGNPPEWLIGTIDWVTKKHLIEQAGADTTWTCTEENRHPIPRAIPDRLLQFVVAAHQTTPLVDPESMEQAVRVPPADSPATMRSHFMREFGSEKNDLSVNWKQVIIGHGFSAKRIRLAKYARDRSNPAASTKAPSHES